MLPVAHRLHDSADFFAVLRSRHSGRSGSDLLVILVCATGSEPVRVGLVVSKTVGNAVVRNRTIRVLRHLMAARLAQLPVGVTFVIRAKPAAVNISSDRLGVELDQLIVRAVTAMK